MPLHCTKHVFQSIKQDIQYLSKFIGFGIKSPVDCFQSSDKIAALVATILSVAGSIIGSLYEIAHIFGSIVIGLPVALLFDACDTIHNKFISKVEEERKEREEVEKDSPVASVA